MTEPESAAEVLASDPPTPEPSPAPESALAPDSAPVPESALAPDSTPVPEDVARLPFDAALAELQSVVGRLEGGGLALEDSIALYERGVALHERCAGLLGDAELRVRRLVESSGGALRTIDLRPGDEDDP
ncbi:MAG TPA: exodeoxyribonuclease VII small subunit [Candidatus Limnocylindrales bacterium]|jgi:exodeoxyribonuclease VII small subunit|nr:exodeoxyribonuclease VII small subunit [Candidatus Limnocylindrales bacterium]